MADADDKAAEKAAAEAAKAKEEAAAQQEKMINGEVPLDNPDSADWPDDVPVQSRYGDPADQVTAQSLQAANEEDTQDAAKQTQPKGEPAPTKTAPAEQPAKSEPAPK